MKFFIIYYCIRNNNIFERLNAKIYENTLHTTIFWYF